MRKVIDAQGEANKADKWLREAETRVTEKRPSPSDLSPDFPLPRDKLVTLRDRSAEGVGQKVLGGLATSPPFCQVEGPKGTMD